ncbi:MAG: glycosyltransferase family 4 protein [Bacteroidia bacterium]|nr:glycosyltransferase family 4 protein [Bacteroidia bacterium]
MTSKRKICFILPHFFLEYSGGAEIQCYYLAQELLSRGWEVHYLRESDKTGTEVMDGIQVHALPRRKSYLKWMNAAALRAKMQEIKADVWYNRATVSYLHLVTRFARQTGGQVAFAFSRDSQFSYQEHRDNYARAYMKVFATVDLFMFFRALRQADHILVQTLKQQELLRSRLQLSGTHIYNAHPLEEAQSPAPARQPHILWIARIKTFKHPEYFIEIARRLRETPYQFFLIGKLEDTQLRGVLETAAEELPHLHIMGGLTSEEVHEALSQARILVNTSDFEGFSNTFIEAWLRGVPVASLRVDPDGMISREGLGLIEPDLDKVSAAIQHLMEDNARWEQLSGTCESFARNHFDIRRAADRLEATLIP